MFEYPSWGRFYIPEPPEEGKEIYIDVDEEEVRAIEDPISYYGLEFLPLEVQREIERLVKEKSYKVVIAKDDTLEVIDGYFSSSLSDNRFNFTVIYGEVEKEIIDETESSFGYSQKLLIKAVKKPAVIEVYEKLDYGDNYHVSKLIYIIK